MKISHYQKFDYSFHYDNVQSFIVPLQGFFNAIVYGWTREDFVQLLAIGVNHFDDWYLEEQGILPPEGSEGQPLQSSHRQSDASITDKLTTSTASCISNNDQQ